MHHAPRTTHLICHTPSKPRIGNSCSAIPHGLGSITSSSSILFLRKDDHWSTLYNDHWYSNDCIGGIIDSKLRYQTSLVFNCSTSPCVLYQKALAFVVFLFSSSSPSSDRVVRVVTAKKAEFNSSLISPSHWFPFRRAVRGMHACTPQYTPQAMPCHNFPNPQPPPPDSRSNPASIPSASPPRAQSAHTEPSPPSPRSAASPRPSCRLPCQTAPCRSC
jgi:hypothetical protein